MTESNKNNPSRSSSGKPSRPVSGRTPANRSNGTEKRSTSASRRQSSPSATAKPRSSSNSSSQKRPASSQTNRRPVNTPHTSSDMPVEKRNTSLTPAKSTTTLANPAPNGKKKKKKTKLSIAKRIAATIFTGIISVFMIVVITGTICCAALTVWVLEFMDDSNDVTLAEFVRNYNTYVYAENADTGEFETVYQVNNANQCIPVNIDTLPQYVRDAFVYIEDERFYSHDGVDYKRTFASFLNMFLHFWDTKQGGSTITQQLIKNITGEDDTSGAAGIQRKIKEIFRAMSFERRYSKTEILANYLDCVEFVGGKNGIELAAQSYFGKSASELTIAEAACLAAIPKSPSYYNPLYYPENNKERQEIVLYKMYENGAISYDQYISALNEKLILTNSEEYKQLHPELQNDEEEDVTTVTPWYVDAAIYELADRFMEEDDIEQDEAIAKINRGGYQIYLTVDLKMQNFVEQKYLDQNNFSTYTSSTGESVQSSFIAMNYNGEIKAVVGGIGDKSQMGSLCLVRAVQSKRDAGSCIKPVSSYGYALFNDQITWSTKIDDSPIMDIDGTPWPSNYSNRYGQYGSSLCVFEGLYRSINTIPAHIVQNAGLQPVFDFATQNMGLDLVATTDSGASDIAYSPLVVGGLTNGVTLENLVNAYIPYGNGGTQYTAHIISQVLNGDGSLLFENTGDPHTAVDADTAYIMNKLLQNVAGHQGGTGTKAALSNKTVACKTGTSQEWRDLSFVGLTEDFVSGIWVGFDNPESMQDAGINSAQVWQNVIGEYANSLPVGNSYPEDNNVIVARYCIDTGLIANDNCPNKSSEVGYFKPSNAKYCTCGQ